MLKRRLLYLPNDFDFLLRDAYASYATHMHSAVSLCYGPMSVARRYYTEPIERIELVSGTEVDIKHVYINLLFLENSINSKN